MANSTGPVVARGPFLFVTASLVLAGGFFFCLSPSESGHYLPCLFHQWTGLYCPGCGGQRAVHALLHGQVGQALQANLLVVLVAAPVAGYWWLDQALARVGRRLPVLWLGRPGWWLLCGITTLYTLLRNLPGNPWRFLRPG